MDHEDGEQSRHKISCLVPRVYALIDALGGSSISILPKEASLPSRKISQGERCGYQARVTGFTNRRSGCGRKVGLVDARSTANLHAYRVIVSSVLPGRWPDCVYETLCMPIEWREHTLILDLRLLLYSYKQEE